MRLDIYHNKQKWPIGKDDEVFVPFRTCSGLAGKTLVLDGDFCATSEAEAKAHWWFRDCPEEASVETMTAGEYIKNCVVRRSDMNPFFTLGRLETIENNRHLTT